MRVIYKYAGHVKYMVNNQSILIGLDSFYEKFLSRQIC